MIAKLTKFTKYPFHTVICATALHLTFAEPSRSATMATATVDIFVTDIGMGVFQYDLTITNTGLEDISLISINDAPLNESILGSSLQSPPEFLASYDPGLGVIDLVENTSTFTAGSVNPGFTFQSASAPDVAFQDLSGFTSLGDSVTVTTNVVPEPSAALLAAAGILAFVTRRRR